MTLRMLKQLRLDLEKCASSCEDVSLEYSKIVYQQRVLSSPIQIQHGNVRLELMREDIPISKRLRASLMVNTDKEYMVGLNYIVGKNVGFRTHYDSDMGFGVGLSLNY